MHSDCRAARSNHSCVRYTRACPELQLEQRFVIEDAGHLSYVDQPQAFNQIMLTIQEQS